MSALSRAIEDFLKRHRLDPQHLLVAVSGGGDSTALLLASLEAGAGRFMVSAAHVNHHLRGEESAGDEEFVREISLRHDVPLHVAHAPLDERAVRARGVEAAAREQRYAALESLRAEARADYVATAHHQDDQAETLLMRLVTGSGIERLSGIRPVAGRILRPLLAVRRSALDAFLAESGIEARRDSSNAAGRFLRNRIRAEVLPLLETINPKIVPTLADTAARAAEQREIVNALVERLSARFVSRQAAKTVFALAELPPEPWLRRAILRREIDRLDPDAREVTSADLERLAALFDAPARTSVTRRLELVPRGAHVELRLRPRPSSEYALTLAAGESATIDAIGATVSLSRVPRDAPFDPSGGCRQQIQLPGGSDDTRFMVRNRRAGDRIRPLGSNFEKKVSELLIDRKIPAERRDRIPLVVWHDRVVWIAGVEVSEDFKVADLREPRIEIRVEYGEE